MMVNIKKVIINSSDDLHNEHLHLDLTFTFNK